MTIKMAVAMTTMMMMRMRMNMMTMTVMIMDGYDCGEDFFFAPEIETNNVLRHASLARAALYSEHLNIRHRDVRALGQEGAEAPGAGGVVGVIDSECHLANYEGLPHGL